MNANDGIKEIETCLQCKKKICDNCLARTSYHGKTHHKTYCIKNRETGEVIVTGTPAMCSAALGIGVKCVRKNGKKGGTRLLIYEEVG